MSSKPIKRMHPWQKAIVVPLWVLTAFLASQLVVVGLILLAKTTGIPVSELNPSVLNFLLSALVYVLTLIILVGVPWWFKKRTSRQEIGLTQLPTWTDLGLAPAGFIVYLIASGLVVYLLGLLIPAFDATQVQEVGFDGLSMRYEYILAFIALVVIAPFAEEVLFRGYLYGKLRRSVPVWGAVLITSVLFGLVHGQWNVGVDVFVLSLVACSLREITGSIWAGILLHMIKNGVAFYLLFINTSFLVQ